MATTTNYGWTTPDDTALVKDGASAIRTLGSSIDTTTKNLNPSTTLGDIEYRSSTSNTNTRVPIGTSGQSLTVVAGVPAWAASATSVLTTTGDLLYASAANTLARIGIGTTGQVLTVSGGIPSWAAAATGGMTLLSTTSLSGATVSISSISQAYKDLFLIVSGVTNATADGRLRIAVNGSTSTTTTTQFNSSTNAFGLFNNDYLLLSSQNLTRTDANNAWAVSIHNYASTTAYKPVLMYGNVVTTAASPGKFGFGTYDSNTAVTSLVFSNSGGNLSTGTVLLYGVS